MGIAAVASRGSLASAKAIWQPVSKEGGEGRQNKPAGGSVLHVSCRLGVEILEYLGQYFNISSPTFTLEAQNSM